ncbi:hypothetical protein YC2023_093976 [Brassica napus]
MGRMVEIHPGLGFKELEDNVLREFRLDEGHFRVSLSYWPPSSFELATGIRTPPVLITSDCSLKYFCQHMKVKGGMNLFARFDAKPKDVDTEVVDDSGMCFVSPTAARFQGSGEFGSGRSRKGYLSSAASKTKVINLEDDDDFVREVEKVEGIMFSDSCKAEEVSGCSLGTDEEENVERELDEIELRPRGYDKEFWDPLLAGDYGGSNAVNVVFNEDEIVEGLKKKNGPRSYFCDTNSCFDHWVEVGGGSVGDNKAKVENFGGVGSDDVGSGGGVGSGDDTEYDAAEIPDMDVDEGDGNIEVGKVFGSKSDCQIALAIYAIKKQFKFTQTRTKLDSFVVECPDSKCDWRVTAHEIRGCGYYEIRKAQLDHSCPIEFRSGYKSKATSRIIASVYKAKFGDPGKAPIARDLQRLVLEELRVNASYMKCYRAKEKAIIGLPRNVNSRFSSKNLAKMVTAAAMAHRLRDFRNIYGKIRATNSACGVYLGKIGVARWSRANFAGERYNIMTSNIAEQLNKALLEGRGANIVELVTFIQRMMTRWFSARRKKAEKHRGVVSAEVDKQMTKNMATVRGSKINSVSSWSSEIVGKFGGKDQVMLAERKCSCKYFDDIKIPCGHAMLAADGVGVPYDTLCGHWYKTTTWRETYTGVINPDGDPRDFEIPEEVSSMVLYPPITKRQAGRRRKTRIPSTGEYPQAPKKKLVPNKCGRCRVEGHNRTNCTNPI